MKTETENERWHRIMSEPTPRVESYQRERKTPLQEAREAHRAALEDIDSFARIAIPGLFIGWLVLGFWILTLSRS